jgi:hypothetical protein
LGFFFLIKKKYKTQKKCLLALTTVRRLFLEDKSLKSDAQGVLCTKKNQLHR